MHHDISNSWFFIRAVCWLIRQYVQHLAFLDMDERINCRFKNWRVVAKQQWRNYFKCHMTMYRLKQKTEPKTMSTLLRKARWRQDAWMLTWNTYTNTSLVWKWGVRLKLPNQHSAAVKSYLTCIIEIQTYHYENYRSIYYIIPYDVNKNRNIWLDQRLFHLNVLSVSIRDFFSHWRFEVGSNDQNFKWSLKF